MAKLSHQGCGVILGSRSSFRNTFIRHRGTPLFGEQYPSILSLYSLNGRGEIWGQTEVAHHAGPKSKNNPTNCPPTSVLCTQGYSEGRKLRDQEAGGSNPLAPTNSFNEITYLQTWF
jgi:hypothetical protein